MSDSVQPPTRGSVYRLRTLGPTAPTAERAIPAERATSTDVRDRTGSHWYCVVAVSDASVTALETTTWKPSAYYPGAPTASLGHASIITYLPQSFSREKLVDAELKCDCPREALRAASSLLRAIIWPSSSSRAADLNALLPPPSLRQFSPPRSLVISTSHSDFPGRTPSSRHIVATDFAILRRLGWRPPNRGDLVAFPEWHVLGTQADGIIFVVLSSGDFNRRFPYPKVILVPLLDVSAEQGERSARSQLIIKSGIPSRQPREARIDLLTTFDFALHYFSPCAVCGFTWRADAASHGSACLRCADQDQVVELPEIVGILESEDVNRIAAAVCDRLQLPE